MTGASFTRCFKRGACPTTLSQAAVQRSLAFCPRALRSFAAFCNVLSGEISTPQKCLTAMPSIRVTV